MLSLQPLLSECGFGCVSDAVSIQQMSVQGGRRPALGSLPPALGSPWLYLGLNFSTAPASSFAKSVPATHAPPLLPPALKSPGSFLLPLGFCHFKAGRWLSGLFCIFGIQREALSIISPLLMLVTSLLKPRELPLPSFIHHLPPAPTQETWKSTPSKDCGSHASSDPSPATLPGEEGRCL